MTAHAFVPPAHGLDFAPIGAIKPESAKRRSSRLSPRLDGLPARRAGAAGGCAARRAGGSRADPAPPPPLGHRRLRLTLALTALARRRPRLYRKGDLAGGDGARRRGRRSGRASALEWLALRAGAAPVVDALAAFLAAHPHWPGAGWIRERQEAELADHPRAPARSPHFSPAIRRSRAPASSPPRALRKRWAAPRRRRKSSAPCGAGAISTRWRRAAIKREFGAADEGRPRISRRPPALCRRPSAALRAAALAGPDVLALAQARIAADARADERRVGHGGAARFAQDPGLLFARVQYARRAGRAGGGGACWPGAARRAALIDPDRWWSERRMVARELLDLGEPQKAFASVTRRRPDGVRGAGRRRLSRRLDRPAFPWRRAESGEALCDAAAVAENPLSIARAAYWQGRAAEAMGDPKKPRVL